MTKPFKVLFPTLTSGELNMLIRIVEADVIGSNNMEIEWGLLGSNKAEQLRNWNTLRAAQRERLRKLMGGEDV